MYKKASFISGMLTGLVVSGAMCIACQSRPVKQMGKRIMRAPMVKAVKNFTCMLTQMQ